MFGYIYSPDARDKYYPMARVLGTDRNENRSLPNKRVYATGPILDQGSTQKCVGYAFDQWIKSAPLITCDGPNAEDIYAAANATDGLAQPHDGTTIRAALKTLQKRGYIASYVWAFDVPSMVEWVLSGHGTIVMGTAWYKGMNILNKQGIVSLTGPIINGHAYLLTGYDQERHLFRIVNSWGINWGDYGEAWIRGDDMALLLATGEACCGVEQKVEEKNYEKNKVLQGTD